MTADRGVSDLVAFLLIFVVMIASIGVVSAFGMSALEDARDHEQLDSAQVSMVTLSDQLNGIADHEAPARATELRLGGATLAIDDGPTANVTVTYDDGTNDTVADVVLGDVSYRLDGQRIVVAGGAVFRGGDASGVALTDPPFQCTETQARVNLIAVRAEGTSVVSTGGVVQLQSRYRFTRLLSPPNRTSLYAADNVTVRLENTMYPTAWDRYFQDAGWSGSGGTYVCEGISQGAILRMTRINLRLVS